MAQNAGNGAGQEAQAGHGRSAASASAGTAASGTPSGTPAASRPVDVSLDLPVLIDGQSRVLSLRISRDPQKPDTQPDPKGPEWRVRFSLDLPEGGPVEAAAGLRGISSCVTLRAVEEETLAGFLSRRDTLAALFADEGLELEDLRSSRQSLKPLWRCRKRRWTAVHEEAGNAGYGSCGGSPQARHRPAV
ncbi:flagellar hook-length control protein FliK [Pannonibacter sp. Pt2-lr]